MEAVLVHGRLRSILKENLRGARFLARELKGAVRSVDPLSRLLPEPALALTSAVADFSDMTLSRLEATALGFVAADPDLRAGRSAPRPLASYFPGADDASAEARGTLFARDQYAAAKHVLLEKGAANPSVSEMALAQVHRRLAASDAAGAAQADPCRLAAAVALAIAAARPVAAPVHLIEAETGTARDANLFVAAALGLGLAVASLGDDGASASEVRAAATAAVDIGWAEAEAALAGGAQPALARLFGEWAPHLP